MNNDPDFRIYLCGGPFCSGYSHLRLKAVLEAELWQHNLLGKVEVRGSGCQNRCDFAPNITIWPGPYHYANLDAARLREIVKRHLVDGEVIEEWLMQRVPRG